MGLHQSIIVITLALILHHVFSVLLNLCYCASLLVNSRPWGKEPFHTKPSSSLLPSEMHQHWGTL